MSSFPLISPHTAIAQQSALLRQRYQLDGLEFGQHRRVRSKLVSRIPMPPPLPPLNAYDWHTKDFACFTIQDDLPITSDILPSIQAIDPKIKTLEQAQTFMDNFRIQQFCTHHQTQTADKGSKMVTLAMLVRRKANPKNPFDISHSETETGHVICISEPFHQEELCLDSAANLTYRIKSAPNHAPQLMFKSTADWPAIPNKIKNDPVLLEAEQDLAKVANVCGHFVNATNDNVREFSKKALQQAQNRVSRRARALAPNLGKGIKRRVALRALDQRLEKKGRSSSSNVNNKP